MIVMPSSPTARAPPSSRVHSQYGACRLRRLGRDAFESGQDATDYNLSYTVRSFVPYYAQRMSNAIVIHSFITTVRKAF